MDDVQFLLRRAATDGGELSDIFVVTALDSSGRMELEHTWLCDYTEITPQRANSLEDCMSSCTIAGSSSRIPDKYNRMTLGLHSQEQFARSPPDRPRHALSTTPPSVEQHDEHMLKLAQIARNRPSRQRKQPAACEHARGARVAQVLCPKI